MKLVLCIVIVSVAYVTAVIVPKVLDCFDNACQREFLREMVAHGNDLRMQPKPQHLIFKPPYPEKPYPPEPDTEGELP